MLEKRSLNLELAKDKNTKNFNLLQKILLIRKLNINKYKQSLLILYSLLSISNFIKNNCVGSLKQN